MGIAEGRKVTLEEIKTLAEDARESIWEKAQAYGRDPKIYLHWTAGHYDQHYDDYHISIGKDGDIRLMVDRLDEVVNHTWRRNSGAIGVALACAAGSGSESLGDEPPTAAQIEAMAQVGCVLADALWLTIDKAHVMTHGEAANNEDGETGYHNPYAWWNDSYGDGDTRGDLEYLGTKESPSYNPEATDGSRGGDVLRGKMNYYRNKSKESEN